MSDLRAVFVHNGSHGYYLKCAERAKVLGFPTEMLSLSCSTSLWGKFSSAYVHMSSNSREFELGCFMRYFVILDFMCRECLDDCLMLDSDFYVNAVPMEFDGLRASNVQLGACQPWDSEAAMVISPHISYWTFPALQRFTQWLVESFYSHPSILEKHNAHKTCGYQGGVCDMTALYLFVKSNSENLLFHNFLAKEAVLDLVADHNVNIPRDLDLTYDTSGRFKMLAIREGHVFFSVCGALVRPLGIHFQGKAKHWIAPMPLLKHSWLLWYVAGWFLKKVKSY